MVEKKQAVDGKLRGDLLSIVSRLLYLDIPHNLVRTEEHIILELEKRKLFFDGDGDIVEITK
jgi:hypothetical protein